MVKPKEFFDFGFLEQSTFLKDGLRKKTNPDHWALLEYSKGNGLFTQQDPERNKITANYEAENLYMAFQQASNIDEWKNYLENYPPSPEILAVLMLVVVGDANAVRSSKSANKGHDKLGGSRDKKRQILDIWSEGKYSSKDICAEQECAGLAVSFSKARKDLRNAPDPNPWPAKYK